MNFIALSTLLVLQVLAQCQNPTVRREWRQLSSGEQTNFLNAVQSLKSRSPGGSNPVTWSYDQFADCHNAYSVENHGTPAFFSWHRTFVNNYESALRSIDSSVSLPYWDWTLDSQNPGASPVLSSNAFGKNGSPGTNCVNEGVAAGWKSSVGGANHCLRRCNQFSALYPPAALTALIGRATSYATLSSSIENGPHGTLHNQFGGSCGDFAQMWSANDPVFFLHHAMVDKIWWRWQSQCTTFASDSSGSLSAPLQPFTGRVSDMMDTQGGALCYTYSRSGGDTPLTLRCPSGQLAAPGTNGEVQGKSSVETTATSRATNSATATATAAAAIALSANELELYWLESLVQSLMVGAKSKAVSLSSLKLKVKAKRGMSNEGQISYEHANNTHQNDQKPTITKNAVVVITRLPEVSVSISGYGSQSQATEAALQLTRTAPANAVPTATHPEPLNFIMTFPTNLKMTMMPRPTYTALPVYTFNTSYTIRAPKANNFTDLVHLRHSEPMDKSFIEGMMLDEYKVRETEIWVQNYIDKLNNEVGYVSPAALVNCQKSK